MTREVQCSGCGARYRIADTHAGRKGRCRQCGSEIVVGEEAAPAGAESRTLPRQMLANRTVAGRTCPGCGEVIDLGIPIRNCELCFAHHHEACWTARGGCGTPDCRNAPPPEIKRPAGVPPPPGGAAVAAAQVVAAVPTAVAAASEPTAASRPTKPCPHCGEAILAAARKCRFCGEYLQRVAAPGPGATTRSERSGMALASLICGIASIVVCFFGFLLGPVAVGLGLGAKREIKGSGGRLTGDQLATGGLVTGALGTVLSVILMIISLVAE